MGVADDLSAQGRSLRARQTKGGTDVPEERTPTPTVHLRADILLLAKVLEGDGGTRVMRI